MEFGLLKKITNSFKLQTSDQKNQRHQFEHDKEAMEVSISRFTEKRRHLLVTHSDASPEEICYQLGDTLINLNPAHKIKYTQCSCPEDQIYSEKLRLSLPSSDQ